MRGINGWSHDRYRPAVHSDDVIYINRIIPCENSIALFWEHGETCKALFRKKGSEESWTSLDGLNNKCLISELNVDTDYEFFVESANGLKSEVGYARTGYVPGKVVNYLHPDDKKYSFSGNYLCSPCLLCHPDGYYLASMDLFANATPQNLTLIFRSGIITVSCFHVSGELCSFTKVTFICFPLLLNTEICL